MMWWLLLHGCAPETTSPAYDGTLVLPLRWVDGGQEDGWVKARAGLWWSLSSLGALPPADEVGLEVHAEQPGEVLFTVDLAAVGFPPAVWPVLEALAEEVQTDPSVAAHGGMDLGRFVMRSLHEPWRYYALTGACETLTGWQDLRQSTEVATYAVTESLLVEGVRLIEFAPDAQALSAVSFRALELEGDLDAPHAVSELEVIDVMPNGRQRYAIYGIDGALRPASDPAVSPAGQPGRCLWCHEGTLMIGQPNPTVKGYTPYDTFAQAVTEQVALLDAHRDTLETAVDFEERDVHTWAERTVEAFLHPTAARVAVEWGVSLSVVEALGLPQYSNEEYPEWDPVYARSDIDEALFMRAGWRPVRTQDSGRELDPDTAVLAEAGLLDCQDVHAWQP